MLLIVLQLVGMLDEFVNVYPTNPDCVSLATPVNTAILLSLVPSFTFRLIESMFLSILLIVILADFVFPNISFTQK